MIHIAYLPDLTIAPESFNSITFLNPKIATSSKNKLFLEMSNHGILVPAVVKRMVDDGILQKKVAFYFSVTPSAVSKSLKKIESGEPDLHIGRPSGLTKDVGKRLVDTFLENPFTHLSELRGIVDPPVSTRTLINWMHQLNFRSTTSALKRYLTHSHKQERVSFANDHKRDPEKKYIFVDECQFDSDGHKNHCWIPESSDRPIIEYPNPPIRVQIFMGISFYGGKSKLVFLPLGQRSTADNYLAMLKKCFTTDPFFNNVDETHFYQDNAPPHKGEDVADYIDNQGLELVKAPANSPDLNPIENIWKLMKQRMPIQGPKNETEMKSQIQTVYESISNEEIQKMISHLTKVKQSIINNVGGHSVGE